MGTLTHILGQVDGARAVLQAIEGSIVDGHLGLAREQADLLIRLLDGHQVPTCVACDTPISSEEQDRFTSWCADCVPALTIRFE